MEIYYNSKHLYKNNLVLTIEETQQKPIIKLNLNSKKFYTLVIFDPDAIGGNKIHFLLTNITNNDVLTGIKLIKYKGPSPPKNSGIHHYIFCLLEQVYELNNTNIEFNSRFIELVDLFRKIKLSAKNTKICLIKYFIIDTNNM